MKGKQSKKHGKQSADDLIKRSSLLIGLCDEQSEIVVTTVNRAAVCYCVNELAFVFNELKLKEPEERTVVYLQDIYSCYKKALLFAGNAPGLMDKQAKGIVLGICDIFVAELKEAEGSGIWGGNGLKYKTALSGFKAAAETVLKPLDNIICEGRSFLATDYSAESLLNFHDFVADQTVMQFGKPLYNKFISCTQHGAEHMINTRSEETSTYCRDLLRKQYDLLFSIVGIQLKALEERKTENVGAAFLATSFIDEIRNGYERLRVNLGELDAMYEKKPEPVVPEFDSFIAGLRSFVDDKDGVPDSSFERTKYIYSVNQEAFVKQLGVTAGGLLVKSANSAWLSKQFYELQKSVHAQAMLTKEIAQILSAITNYYEVNSLKDTPGQKGGIISGIAETVAIKTDCLMESALMLEDDASGLFKEYGAKKALPTAEEEESYRDYLFALWQDALCESPEEKPDMNSILTQESEVSKALADRALKLKTELGQKAGKLLTTQLKEGLLFEISTFEEIINHSVNRLSENEDDTGFGSVVTDVWGKIQVSLKKNGIDVISPAPGTQFNAKETEILMAESKEGFDKGQIIKTLNTGYKKDGIVILRANVIAAR